MFVKKKAKVKQFNIKCVLHFIKHSAVHERVERCEEGSKYNSNYCLSEMFK